MSKLEGDPIEIMRQISDRFESRYRSYRQMIGKQDTARAWKRAWLDMQREIRKIDKPH